MANYINTEILCEAYSHLKIDLYEDKAALEHLRTDLTAFFSERAKFFLGTDVSVEVSFERGSLKTILTVVGSAVLVINSVIGGYGSFRQGIDQLSKDAALLAQSANLEVIFRTKTEYCNRVNVERRKGIFGRIDESIKELDAIKIAIKDSTLPTTDADIKEIEGVADRLASWDRSLDKLFAKTGNQDTEACVASGMLEELERLPTSVPWLSELNSSSFRATVAKSNPDRAARIAAAAKRLEVLVEQLKGKLALRVKQAAPQTT